MGIRRALAFAVPLALLAAFPLLGSAFYVELVAKVMILAILAMSLDLLVGGTGLVSFGHAAYFGIGAYALGLAAPRYEAASLLATLPLAVGAAALAALAVGALVVRVQGVYFIMATLAFSQMFYFLVHDTEFGRGSDGITIALRPVARVAGFRALDLDDPRHVYGLVLAAFAGVLFFLRALRGSPFGRALQGIRQNEHRMRSLGFPVYRYKLTAFTLAGAIAGLAGYLSALQYGFVNPELLSWHQSGNALVMLILGGPGSYAGAALGAFSFVALQEVFQAFTDRWQLALGATIVLLVLALPGGLSSLGERLRRLRGRGSDD
jgi:branched-chain amino acid transport system permease protein